MDHRVSGIPRCLYVSDHLSRPRYLSVLLIHGSIVSADENSPGLGWIASPELREQVCLSTFDKLLNITPWQSNSLMAQVSVRPLIVLPSWPPRYPEDELFTFKPIFRDVMALTTKAGLNIEVTVEDL